MAEEKNTSGTIVNGFELGEKWLPWSKGGGGDVPIATDGEVEEALDDLFDGHN